jgi:hypothetical protein
MTQLKPMRDEGQQSFSTLLRELPSLGIASTTIMTENQLTRLQLRRLVSQFSARSTIRFTEGGQERRARLG